MNAHTARHPGRPILAVVLGVTLLSLTLAAPGLAAIITVTSTGDTIAVDGFVTLREALTAANTNAASGDAPAGAPGLDEIRFNIAGAPGTVHTIQPMSALPTITDPVFINGYSQLGASPNTLFGGNNAFLAIELDGTNTAFVAGLVISTGGSTVRGLVINRFDNEGILIIGAGGNAIRGNFLGTDQTGKIDRRARPSPGDPRPARSDNPWDDRSRRIGRGEGSQMPTLTLVMDRTPIHVYELALRTGDRIEIGRLRLTFRDEVG